MISILSLVPTETLINSLFDIYSIQSSPQGPVVVLHYHTMRATAAVVLGLAATGAAFQMPVAPKSSTTKVFAGADGAPTQMSR